MPLTRRLKSRRATVSGITLFRAGLVVMAAMLVTACSGVRLAYNQLDWLVPAYVNGLVTLDETQSTALDRHLDVVLKWHCGTQFPGYIAELHTVNADFQAGRMTPARLDAQYERLLDYWRAIMEQAAPRLATLLASATDEQVEELFKGLEEKNRKFKAEFVDRSPARLRKDADKTLRSRLSDWVGDLNPEQRRMVSDWSARIPLSGADRLDGRRRWQAALRIALKRRNEPERFERAVHALFVHYEHYWTPEYREKSKRIREHTLALLVEMGATLTKTQREHLTYHVGDWAGDFERLSCVGKPAREEGDAPTEQSDFGL